MALALLHDDGGGLVPASLMARRRSGAGGADARTAALGRRCRPAIWRSSGSNRPRDGAGRASSRRKGAADQAVPMKSSMTYADPAARPAPAWRSIICARSVILLVIAFHAVLA